jgi:hypothetical protein
MFLKKYNNEYVKFMQKIKLMNFIFLYSVFIYSNITFSQKNITKTQNFILINLGKEYSEQQLITAIEKADWCGYYHKTENFKITFDDGSLVELLSYRVLAPLGFIVEPKCIQDEVTTDNSIYGILPSGVISRQVTKNSHVKLH